MVSKPLVLSFYRRRYGSSSMRVACFAAMLFLNSVFPVALVAQEKKTEAKPTVTTADAKQVADKDQPDKSLKDSAASEADASDVPATKAPAMVTVSKASVLVGSFTVFLLAVFVGFEIITKVPPTLHTPLMSGSNAISGITVVGAMIAAGAAAATAGNWFGTLLGMLAVVLAMINVVGGFVVTHRMLKMFKKR
ncbi:MAG: NAD(P) transhydrogenase subunit alpha [Pirellulaceae bacterium]|jgi:NAD(P) transhydrogenase subunit alpha